jgi:hypothetical protein
MSKKDRKETAIQIRLTEYEKGKLKLIADKYAGGNMSLWVAHAIMNAPRKFLIKSKQPQ